MACGRHSVVRQRREHLASFSLIQKIYSTVHRQWCCWNDCDWEACLPCTLKWQIFTIFNTLTFTSPSIVDTHSAPLKWAVAAKWLTHWWLCWTLASLSQHRCQHITVTPHRSVAPSGALSRFLSLVLGNQTVYLKLWKHYTLWCSSLKINSWNPSWLT